MYCSSDFKLKLGFPMEFLSNGGEKAWCEVQRYKQPYEFSISSCWWILCVSSPREKPCSIKKLYSIQKAANILKFGFPPNYLSRVTLPQAKARKKSNFCKCLFWKWILVPAQIAAHCIWHRFWGGNIKACLFSAAICSGSGTVQGLFYTAPDWKPVFLLFFLHSN